jgi:anti-anti-sigma regulatory factor
MKIAVEKEPTYLMIAPDVEILDKEAAEALYEKVKESVDANASTNFIVDLGAVHQLTNESIPSLLALQELVEQNEGALVMLHAQELVLQKIKQERLHLSIQVANSLMEAEDLVNNDEKMARGLVNEM